MDRDNVMESQRPVRLFVSYSRRDEKFCQELRKYLEVDRRLDLWSDERIEAGDDWRREIESALAQADAAILLVSQDFLNSEFIRNNELPTLLESVQRRRLRLFLIPVGASTWRSAVVERFQWVHDPHRPLKALRPATRAQALVEITRKIVDALIGKEGARASAGRLEALSMTHASFEEMLREALPPQYELRRLVSRGQFATIFEAQDALLNRKAAIKAFHELELANDPTLFQYYALSTAGLKHRNICSVYSVQMARLPNYVVSEFLSGESLEKIIARKGRLPFEHALEYFDKVGDALEYAHARDLVHNRLRPAHVMVDKENQPVISGFHTAMTAPSVGRDDRLALEDHIYLSPEVRDGRPATRATDQYLLALLLYEMLAGEPYIAAASWADLPSALARAPDAVEIAKRCACSVELASVLMRMLAPDPSQRYGSIGTAMADAWSISGTRLNRRLRSEAAKVQAEQARASYRRALTTSDLHERIYHAFFRTCPAARALFARTDLKRQYELLHHAIVLMLAFHANPEAQEPTILTRVAARHGQLGMQIPAAWFDLFSTAIRDAVAACDPQWSDSVSAAWTSVLESGTRYMRSYAQSAQPSPSTPDASAESITSSIGALAHDA